MGKFDIKKIFGENVKYYRKKRGLSQEQFAEKLEISPNHISVIETGKKFVTYNLLEKIIETLDVVPSSLFSIGSLAPFDDNLQNKITTLIHTELTTAQDRIQEKLRAWE